MPVSALLLVCFTEHVLNRMNKTKTPINNNGDFLMAGDE
jgi:hypothetical protein